MITVKITEMGNNMIGFYIFNEYNQLIHHFRRSKKDKSKHKTRLAGIYMKKGQSISFDDQTVPELSMYDYCKIGGTLPAY
jgi:hypothetical protein